MPLCPHGNDNARCLYCLQIRCHYATTDLHTRTAAVGEPVQIVWRKLVHDFSATGFPCCLRSICLSLSGSRIFTWIYTLEFGGWAPDWKCSSRDVYVFKCASQWATPHRKLARWRCVESSHVFLFFVRGLFELAWTAFVKALRQPLWELWESFSESLISGLTKVFVRASWELHWKLLCDVDENF